jgi:M3 family oligoendopeptidase
MVMPRPDVVMLAAEALRHADAVRDARTADDQVDAIRAWGRDQVRLLTARALAQLRFELDTRDAAARAEKTFFDDVAPQLLEQRLQVVKQISASRTRPELERRLGAEAFRTWTAELASFDPAMAEDMREEARLKRRYTELTASVRVPFDGQTLTLTQLGGHFTSRSRDVRLRAQQARFAALDAHRAELDAVYDELVALRHGMAGKVGEATYTPLAYTLRRRDYGAAAVAAFRKQVREVVVPAARRIRRRHAEALGVSDYGYHDTFVSDGAPAPAPAGDAEWILDRASRLFAALGPDFGELWRILRSASLIDTTAREGKAPGGFCARLPLHGVPFVFANWDGSAGDVKVLVHECGHAYQGWRSMAVQPLLEYHGPTSDAAEIHSMGLELLTHPHAELFFDGQAERYRRQHLEQALLFIPYGAAIDEFQHEVYADPRLLPAHRAELWRDLESAYLSERRYPGMPLAASGRFWQVQRHVYAYPFYYIDYCLAQACALQLWARARRDRDGAMAAYRHLSEIGGSLPFSGIVEAAGLRSPFAEGCLGELVEDVERTLRG